MQIVVCVGSLCDWRSIHHRFFHVCWHALAQKCWQCLTSLGPSISQSCCFCDAQKLYPTSLYTLTSMAFRNWLFWWSCWSQICWSNVSLPHSCTDYPNLVPLKIACQICKYTQKVKPVCRLSEPSSSWHMLRQKFAGSQVATRATLSLFASKFPLISFWAPAWLKQVAIAYK